MEEYDIDGPGVLHDSTGCTWILEDTLNTSTPCYDAELCEFRRCVEDYTYTTPNPNLLLLYPPYATNRKPLTMINGTTAALARIASLPVTLLGSIPRPNISYIPAAHVKLKAEHIVMVFICVLRQIWLYVEGWRDSRRRRNQVDEDNAEDKRQAKRRSKKRGALGKTSRNAGNGRKVKIVVKGRYTLVLQ